MVFLSLHHRGKLFFSSLLLSQVLEEELNYAQQLASGIITDLRSLLVDIRRGEAEFVGGHAELQSTIESALGKLQWIENERAIFLHSKLFSVSLLVVSVTFFLSLFFFHFFWFIFDFFFPQKRTCVIIKLLTVPTLMFLKTRYRDC